MQFVRQRQPMSMLTYLELRHCYYPSPQAMGQRIGLFSSCLCLILRGRVTVQCSQGSICAQAGDVVYWPGGIPYKSYWEADEGTVEFIGAYHRMHTLKQRMGVTMDQPAIPPCDRFVVFEQMGCAELFRQMDRACHRPGGDCEAVRLFYQLYEQVRGSLPEGRRMKQPVHLAQVFMEANWNRPWHMSELAEHCGLSESRLYHVFKAETGKSPVEFKNEIRIRRAAEMLLREDASVEWISERLHFSSASHFRRMFRKYTGMTPSAYREKVGNAL